MRKNKALLKRAASLFTAFVMLAGSATYGQEEQTSETITESVIFMKLEMSL